MTAVASTDTFAVSSAESPKRIIAVTRLNFVNLFQIVLLPLMILGFILLINIAIWALVLSTVHGSAVIKHTEKGFGYSGGVFFIFIWCLIVAVQAINRTFPLALGFGVTRRDFYLGSALSFVILAIFFSIVLTVLSLIENATNGWGLGGHLFNPNYFTAPHASTRFAIYLCCFLFCLFIGAAVAAVYVRWKSTGMVVFFALFTLILLGVGTIITLTNNWVGFGRWVVDAGAIGLAAWSLIPSAVAAVAGFFILRRATPRT
jgi:hypothetical protein